MPRVIHFFDTFLAATLTCFIPNQGVAALANVISDMKVLTSLNLSSNYLRVEGVKIVVEAIKVTSCVITIVLAPI
jgi:hypothetical protein